MGDDVVGIDHVLARLRHLLDGPDLNRASGGGRERFVALAVPLEAHLRRDQPVAVLAAIGLVHHDALREHGRERLVEGDVFCRLHAAGEEARIKQMQNCVLLAADVLVDRRPVLQGLLVGRRVALGAV